MTEALWTLRLVGALETASPFCVVAPGAEEVLRLDGGKYRLIARRTLYRDGLRDTLPVVPGSTLRGRLRRSAVDVVVGLSGERMSLAAWHQNAIGGVKGAEPESAFDLRLRRSLREKNPILGLFGAGSPWMTGRASIGDAVPEHPVETEIVGAARSDDGRRDGAFFLKLDADAPAQWRAMVDANGERTRLKAKLRALNAALRAARKAKDAEEAARLEAELAQLDEAESQANLLSANPAAMPLQHEAMPAGVRMRQQIVLSAVTAAEAGLFMAALNVWMKANPALGQHENLGYGLLRGEYDAYLAPARLEDPFALDAPPEEPLGTMRLEPILGLSGVPEPLARFMAAFKARFAEGAFDFRLAADLPRGEGR